MCIPLFLFIFSPLFLRAPFSFSFSSAPPRLSALLFLFLALFLSTFLLLSFTSSAAPPRLCVILSLSLSPLFLCAAAP